MANTIKIKTGSGSDPSASDLAVGELALRTDNGKLFSKDAGGSVIELGGGSVADGSITSAKIADGAIVNADVNGSAAIAGSKISPNFGSQDIVTTGNLDLSDSSGSGNNRIKLGTGDDLQIYHEGNNARIVNTDGNFIFDNSSGSDIYINGGNDIHLRPDDFDSGVSIIGDGAVELYHNNSKKFETTSSGAKISGSGAAFLEINSTDGSVNPMVRMTNGDQTFDTGLRGDSSDNWCIYDVTNSDNRFMLDPSGNVRIPNDSVEFSLGASNDLVLEHDGSDSIIPAKNVGSLKLKCNVSNEHVIVEAPANGDFRAYVNNGTLALICNASGQNVELRYGGNKKAETVSGGFTVTGTCTATSFSGDGSNLTNLPSSGLATSGGTLTGTLNARTILPTANNTYDLGSSSARWRNIYTNDLNLSNKGNKNDIDGRWGSYTIQEGEQDLFLINRRNGKKYKFNLTEVN